MDPRIGLIPSLASDYSQLVAYGYSLSAFWQIPIALIVVAGLFNAGLNLVQVLWPHRWSVRDAPILALGILQLLVVLFMLMALASTPVLGPEHPIPEPEPAVAATATLMVDGSAALVMMTLLTAWIARKLDRARQG